MSKRPKSKRPRVKTSQVKTSQSQNVPSQNVPESKCPKSKRPKSKHPRVKMSRVKMSQSQNVPESKRPRVKTFIVLDNITHLKISTSFTAKLYCIECLFNPSLDLQDENMSVASLWQMIENLVRQDDRRVERHERLSDTTIKVIS